MVGGKFYCCLEFNFFLLILPVNTVNYEQVWGQGGRIVHLQYDILVVFFNDEHTYSQFVHFVCAGVWVFCDM